MSLLLRKTIKSNSILQSFKPHNTLPLFLRQSTKHFSTETQQPPPQGQNDSSSMDPFTQDTTTDLTYAKFFGAKKHTLKTDIIHLFEGSNLTLDDIRVVRNRSEIPLFAVIQFPSRRAYENAQKALTKAGRLYSLEKTARFVWDDGVQNAGDGKTVLLEGIPPNAFAEDVERFLSGCDFVPNSIRMFFRNANPNISQGSNNPNASDPIAHEEKRDLVRFASVRFSTRTEAMNASIKKHRGFCLNNQISVRVLH